MSQSREDVHVKLVRNFKLDTACIFNFKVMIFREIATFDKLSVTVFRQVTLSKIHNF